MPLNKATLKTQIKAAFVAQQNKTDNPDGALDDLATKISDAIDAYVKQMTVTSVPVLTSPSGPVTGTITNTVS
jgi:poly-gamma-glutamate capsule biosynthesis protein CapA/YwtB (metallophosphatase superfamily)